MIRQVEGGGDSAAWEAIDKVEPEVEKHIEGVVQVLQDYRTAFATCLSDPEIKKEFQVSNKDQENLFHLLREPKDDFHSSQWLRQNVIKGRKREDVLKDINGKTLSGFEDTPKNRENLLFILAHPKARFKGSSELRPALKKVRTLASRGVLKNKKNKDFSYLFNKNGVMKFSQKRQEAVYNQVFSLYDEALSGKEGSVKEQFERLNKGLHQNLKTPIKYVFSSEAKALGESSRYLEKVLSLYYGKENVSQVLSKRQPETQPKGKPTLLEQIHLTPKLKDASERKLNPQKVDNQATAKAANQATIDAFVKSRRRDTVDEDDTEELPGFGAADQSQTAKTKPSAMTQGFSMNNVTKDPKVNKMLNLELARGEELPQGEVEEADDNEWEEIDDSGNW